MDRQLTVRMSAALDNQLERAAHRLRRSRSDVIRLALEQFLQGSFEERDAQIAPIERVRDLLGSVDSGLSDLGQRHREHLIERLHRTRTPSSRA